MKIDQKTGFRLFIVAIFIFEVIFIASIFYEPKDLKSTDLNLEQKEAMLDLNILCTTNHDHPILTNKELCVHIPNLKERIK